jgi:hypothetical protein
MASFQYAAGAKGSPSMGKRITLMGIEVRSVDAASSKCSNRPLPDTVDLPAFIFGAVVGESGTVQRHGFGMKLQC